MAIVAKRSPISATAEHLFAQLTAESHYTLQRPLPLIIVPSNGGSEPPFNTWFPGPTRVLNSNGISIPLAVFAYVLYGVLILTWEGAILRVEVAAL